MNVKELTRRPGIPDDIEGMYAISKRALCTQVEDIFGPWDDEQQRGMFWRSTDPTTHELFFFGERPVGYWWVLRKQDALVLNRITIDPEFQNRGLGTALLQELMTEAKAARLPLQLQVFPRNPALRLYLRLGFVERGRTERHIQLVWEGE